MGLFDLFSNKEQKTKNDRTLNLNFDDSLGQPNTKSAPVAVFSPTSYNDVASIIDAIRAGKNTVVHLTKVKTETALRVLDMLSGAIYALGGGVYEMDKNVFMFSPAGLEVNT